MPGFFFPDKVYGYFYDKDKNPAILLTLLVLALLL